MKPKPIYMIGGPDNNKFNLSVFCNMKLGIKKNKRGVSLIELIVSVGLFSVVMLSATEIFKAVVDGQRSAISAQNVQENIRYAMEKISKEIRMARISNHECEAMFSPPAPTAVYKVFNTTAGNSQLYFKNQYNQCVVYYLSADLRLKAAIAEGGTIIANGFITPAKIQVSDLQFFVIDDIIGAFHSVQPYITMVMNAKAVGLAIHEQKMKIQMTISSRYYE